MVYFNGKSWLRKKALKALDDTKFYPDKGRERIKAMIETRPDWCVSRQRVWGVPLPIFVHKTTKEILVDDEVMKTLQVFMKKKVLIVGFLIIHKDF